MAIYIIADLHLSFNTNKPMDIFGHNWQNYEEKIKQDWISKVKQEDLVILPGDFSWETYLEDTEEDFNFINNLPGKKILLKGNHDYWWTTVTKLNKLYDDMRFLQNNFYECGDYAICGTRGWTCPNDVKFDEDDEKIYKREAHRLKLSLDAAKKAKYDKIIVMTHYPPTNDKLEDSLFTEIYEQYNVEKVVYGHLHGKESFKMGLKGEQNGVDYILASCDYTNFKLVKIMD